jgi:hypothetical protein
MDRTSLIYEVFSNIIKYLFWVQGVTRNDIPVFTSRFIKSVFTNRQDFELISSLLWYCLESDRIAIPENVNTQTVIDLIYGLNTNLAKPTSELDKTTRNNYIKAIQKIVQEASPPDDNWYTEFIESHPANDFE